jgi:hypothetical protein
MQPTSNSRSPGESEPSPIVRAAEILLLGALPLIAVVLSLAAFSGDGRLALDFHEELYPQADAVVHGRDPYPSPDAPITDTTNAIWPIAAVLPVVPLTALPAETADWIATAFVLATLVAALWILDVRDWRVYGVTLLWPPVIDAYQTANVTLPLVLLVAVAWRYRDRWRLAGAALGVALALKFFLWTLAVWLVATGRRAAGALALAIGAASLLLLTPFIGISDYVHLVRNLSKTFDAHSYTPYALLLDLGTPSEVARAVTLVLGLGLLALSWRRRSLGLALAAALCLSPIVWRHFFALLVVPLALSRPRFDAAWLVPLGMWAGAGTLNGDTWQTAVVLALAALTFVLSERRLPKDRVGTLTSIRAPAEV